jgi:hypothetical protein
MRYTLSLRVFKLDERDGRVRFANHLEQVPDWADSLIVDVGPHEDRAGLQAWAAWNSAVAGPNDQFDPITDGLPEEERRAIQFTKEGDDYVCRIPLPATATALPVLGETAGLKLGVHDRQPPTPPEGTAVVQAAEGGQAH